MRIQRNRTQSRAALPRLPRARLATAELSDADLLNLLLPGARPRPPGGASTGARLLAHFGSLRAVAAASPDSFAAASAGGPASWVRLQAALEFSRRSLLSLLNQRNSLESPSAVRDFLALWLRDRPQECFVGLFLDSQNRLIEAEELFQGSVSQTAVYPREIARRCLELNASAIVVAHNHPSGVAEPSAADRRLTEALRAALRVLDVPVLDHLIVADSRCFSFAEAGLI